MRRSVGKRRKLLRLKRKRARRPRAKSIRLDRPFVPPCVPDGDRQVEW